MRWNRPKPYWDIRTAWWPVTLWSGERLWLEFYVKRWNADGTITREALFEHWPEEAAFWKRMGYQS